MRTLFIIVSAATCLALVCYLLLNIIANSYDREDMLNEILSSESEVGSIATSSAKYDCFVQDGITGNDRIALLSRLDSAFRVYRTAMVENRIDEFLANRSRFQRFSLALSGSDLATRRNILKNSSDLARREGILDLELSLQACGVDKNA